MAQLVNRKIMLLLVGAVVLIAGVVAAAFAVQGVLFPGSPRPDAGFAEARVRQSIVGERNFIELFAGSVRSEQGEWSIRIGDEQGIVEWRDGQPFPIDFELDVEFGVDVGLGLSDSGELLVAQPIDGDIEISTTEGPVAVVQGGDTPIRAVMWVDDRTVFGWTAEGLGAFPIGPGPEPAILNARDARDIQPVGDDYLLFALDASGTNTLTRWSPDEGYTTLVDLPDVEGIVDPSIGVSGDGVAYIGIDDSVWRSVPPYNEIELVTQARVDRGGRWIGWVDIAPDASAWIYHEVDSGYLLTGGPNEPWRQATYFGVPIGERFRLGDANADVAVAHADADQIVVDTYEGRIWISRPG